ncbi:MAG: hypothetical protein ACXWGU_16570 [Usitatibacter sp.]
MTTKFRARMGLRNTFLAALAMACLGASAATKTWTGNGATSNWSEGANWADLSAPVVGDRLVFPAGASRTTSSNDLAVASLDGFEVAGAGYILVGGPLTLTGTAPVAVTAAGASFDAQFDVRLTASSPQIVVATTAGGFPTATATFSGANLYAAPGTVLVDAGSGWIVVNSSIQQTSGAMNLDLHGQQVTLGKVNFFYGNVDSHASLLEVKNSLALGQGGSGIARIFGILHSYNDVQSGYLHPAQTIFSGAGAGAASGDLIASGSFMTELWNLTLSGGTMYVQPISDVQLDIVEGSGTIVIDHADGAVILPASRVVRFTGTFAVRRGSLRSDAHSQTFGWPNSTASVDVDQGGTWHAGGETVVDGLRCRGAISMSLGSESYWAVQASTGADIAGCHLSLVIPVSLAPSADSVFEIVRNSSSPIIGTFAGLPEGSIVNVNGANMTMTYLRDGGRTAALVANYSSTVAARLEAVGSSAGLMKIAGSVISDAFRVRVANNVGSPIAGVRVTFSAQGACGSFAGTTSADVATGADGIAAAPAFTVGDLTGDCTIQATTSGVASPIAFAVYVYHASDLVVRPVPTALVSTIVNLPFQVGVQLSGAQGRAISGAQVSFQVISAGGAGASLPIGSITTDSNGVGMASATANSVSGTYSISATHAAGVTVISISQQAAAPAGAPSVQDMWWSGVAENGWGMSIVQHRDVLFSVIYAYDEASAPTWFVMPNGTWNGEYSIYSGLLYRPRGSPYFSYDATHFIPGDAVGTASLSFMNAEEALLDYTISGVAGRKSIKRQPFGPVAGSNLASHGDMWWGSPSQNGWGVAIMQQYATLFPIWFTYDGAGSPTWLVMPGGTWTSADTYEGRIYQTTGSPWVGHPYDPAQLRVFDAGPYRLRFTVEGATLDYTIDGHAGTLALERQPF